MRSGLALLALLWLVLPVQAADVSGLDWEQSPGAAVPMDVPLVDADGAATTLRMVAGGHPLILAPGYFKCPNLCGVIRDDLFAALALSKHPKAQVALLTIDPVEGSADARAVRAGVLDRYPEARFAALTGPESSLLAIAQASGFHARFDPAARQLLHPAGIVILTPSGHVSSYLLGVGYAAQDLDAALADAQAGAFRRAEPIHLFCFSYDPATGRLTATVMEAVRIGGVLTVLAIAALLLLLGRRA